MLDKININGDDSFTNEYLHCFDDFKEMPSKISIFNIYDSKDFLNFISDSIEVSTTKEIIPSDNRYIINEKNFIKLDIGVYMSYFIYDKLSESSYISDVVVYYKISDKQNVSLLLEKINEFTTENDTDISKFYTISINSSDGVQLTPLEILDNSNIDLYYNDNITDEYNDMISMISKSKKGLSIVYGERGVGKTSFVRSLMCSIDKSCITIPSNMTDVINTCDLKNIISDYTDSIVMIDDCELFFSNRYPKSNIFSNNLLQLVDGISSDMDNIHIILVLNVSDISDIDETLLECNNLLKVLKIERLDDKKSMDICEKMKKKMGKMKNPRLIDLIKKDIRKDSIKMGFH